MVLTKYCRNWLFLLPQALADQQSNFDGRSVQSALIFCINGSCKSAPGFGNTAVTAGIRIFLCRHRSNASIASDANVAVSPAESEWISAIVADICFWVWRQMLPAVLAENRQ